MAYGAVPGPDEGIGVPTSPPDFNDDIHAIRERYVIPKINTPLADTYGAFIAKRFDARNQKINAMLVSVRSGTLFGYFGDFTTNSGKTPTTPHFIVSASITPQSQTIPIAPDDQYIITLQEGLGATVEFAFTVQAL